MSIWPAPPVIPGRWRTVPGSEAVTLASRLGNALGRHGVALVWQTEITRFRALPLTCLPNWLLVEYEARFSDGPSGVASFLYGPDMQIVPLDLTSAPLYYAAGVAPLDMSSASSVVEFLRCFCGSIASEEGRFRVVSSAQDLNLLPGVLDDETVKRIGQIRRPRVSWVEATDKQPRKARVVASMLYADSLFRTTYELGPGEVSMVEDVDLGPLPVRHELVRAPFRTLLDGARPAAPPSQDSTGADSAGADRAGAAAGDTP